LEVLEPLEGAVMVSDRIERDVYIVASVPRVWEVVTEPKHVGMWFGNGEPAEIELRPGGRIVFDHGDHGKLPAVVVEVDEPRYFSFRWAADDTTEGREPTETNATLVEFTLEPEGEGTRLRIVESGFKEVIAEPDVLERRQKANGAGWGRALLGLANYAEFLAYDEEGA
jgi:uncharacterized protein YndB with AHSA1/START domain